MTENKTNNDVTPNKQVQDEVPAPGQKKRPRPLWILFLIFIVFVLMVFIFQKRDSIDWVEDYQAGLEMARQQSKPVLLAFYKVNTPMSTQIWQNTYNNPAAIEYVESKFVPILIDVDKQPEIAKSYNIDYYPTHYTKQPDGEELFGPLLGYDPAPLFIEKLEDLLKKMNAADK
jgi:hypothetical protein